jgi:VCBS repeat-containing protein
MRLTDLIPSWLRGESRKIKRHYHRRVAYEQFESRNLLAIAADDVFTMDEDTALFENVLANDESTFSMTAVLIDGPANGTFTLNSDGSFEYTPTANFVGEDSFSYTAQDGYSPDDAIVTITVVDDLTPIDDYVSMPLMDRDNDNTWISQFDGNVLDNDLNPDNVGLFAYTVEDSYVEYTGLGGFGTLFMSGDPNYWITYTTTRGPSTASFQYTINMQSSLTGTVWIEFSLAPEANDDTYETPPNTTLNIGSSGVLANDSDPEADALSARLVTAPDNGTLTLNSDGSFSYTPDTGFQGLDSFSYKAHSGFEEAGYESETAVVTIDIGRPDAIDDSYTMSTNGTLNISPESILDNDIDEDPLTVALVDGPSHGTLTLHTDGTFTYTPNTSYHGVDSFEYEAYDGVRSDSAVVRIGIENSAPVIAEAQYAIIQENNAYLDAPMSANVLVDWASDPDNDVLTAELVGSPSHGTVQLESDGDFLFTPDAGYYGYASFQIRATDGLLWSNTQTVYVPASPHANDDSYSVAMNGVLQGNVGANDVGGEDGETPTVPLGSVVGPQHGDVSINANGEFTYTPDNGYTGPDSFSYWVQEIFSGVGFPIQDQALVTITVTA